MRRPPASVAFVARTHWLVGAVALGSVGVLHLISRGIHSIAFGPRTYAITLGIAALYLVGGTLVWFGTPFGRFVNLLCSLLYLVRPRLGDPVWASARSEDFKAHFARGRQGG